MSIAATLVGRRIGVSAPRALLLCGLLFLGGCAEDAAPHGAALDTQAEVDTTPDMDVEVTDLREPRDLGNPTSETDTTETDTTETDTTGPDTTEADTTEADTTETDTTETDTTGPDTTETNTTESDTTETDTTETDTTETDTTGPDTTETDTTGPTPSDADDTDDTFQDQSDASSPGPDADTVAPSDTSPTCSPCATGRIRFERRRPNAALTGLGPLEFAPLAHHPIGLVGTSHHTLTDANGWFELQLPTGQSCHLTFAALLPRDPSTPFVSPSLAVLSTDLTTLPNIGAPPFSAERLWAWSTTCQPDVPLDLVIRLSDGAGALSAFETARQVLATLTEHFGPTELDLALVWERGRAWSCGSCYLDARFSGVTHAASGHHFPHAIFLSGTNANPHQFTPSVIAHELGHFALELWSSPPLIGGAHGFDRRVDPILAWSEGAATLIGQWALIGHTPIARRFFAVQQNVQYWVDLEAIGRAPTSDDSNLNLLVPLPRPLDPLDQPLSEGVVAAILWDLLDANEEHPGELIALGPLLLSLLGDPRLADVRSGPLDRGGLGPDLVDLLDALRCDPALHDLVGPPSTLPPALTSLLLDFPYDDHPLCGASRRP